MLQTLAARGLLYVDPRPGAASSARRLARRERGSGGRRAGRAAEIEAKLAALERIAREQGAARWAWPARCGPVTVDRIAAWATGSRRAGLALAPVSALVQPPAKQRNRGAMTDSPICPTGPNVGAVLFNRAGLVFVARRADLPNAEGAPGGWQLPQGGIDADEDPRSAVLRELAEEIGTDRAEIIGEHPEWLTYDLPPELLGVALGGRYPRPAAALVRAALHRRGRRHPARPRPASGIRRLALGAAGRASRAGGRLQAGDL